GSPVLRNVDTELMELLKSRTSELDNHISRLEDYCKGFISVIDYLQNGTKNLIDSSTDPLSTSNHIKLMINGCNILLTSFMGVMNTVVTITDMYTVYLY